jgi:hypothetical protein
VRLRRALRAPAPADPTAGAEGAADGARASSSRA